MLYRDYDPTPAEKTAIPSVPENEVETSQRRTAPGNLWARPGGPPADAGEALRKSTDGRLARAGNTLLHLQSQYGNQYVQRLINPQQRLTVQPKLMLGEVDTPSEQEAEQASRAISRGRPLGAPPTPVNGPVLPVTAQTESAINQARGGGQPLPENNRTQMEQSLGTDLSAVRVHTDSRADSLNQALQAKAFTTGQDIFFRQGAYTPETTGGQQLLAHELTHVIQQISPVSSPVVQRNPNDNDEAEEHDTTEIGLILAGGLGRIAVGVGLGIPHAAAMLAAPLPMTIIGFVRHVFGAIQGVCQTIRAGVMLFVRKAAAKIRTASEKIISALSGIEQALSRAVAILDVASFANIARLLAGGFAFAENAVRQLEHRGIISESPRLRAALHTVSEMATVFANLTSEGIGHALLDFAKEYGEKILIKIKRFAGPYLPQRFSQQLDVTEQSEEKDMSWIEDFLNELPEEEDQPSLNNKLDEIPKRPGVNKPPTGQINWEEKQEAKLAENARFMQQEQEEEKVIEELFAMMGLNQPPQQGNVGQEEEDQSSSNSESDDISEQGDVGAWANEYIDEHPEDLFSWPEEPEEEEQPTLSDQNLSSNEIPQQQEMKEQEMKAPSPPNVVVSAPAPPSQNVPEYAGRKRKWLRVMNEQTSLRKRPGGQTIHKVKEGDFVYMTGKISQSGTWVKVRYYLKSGKYSTKESETVTGWVPKKSLRLLNAAAK
jgi:hypothetical protein